jgi:hypothetical protein
MTRLLMVDRVRRGSTAAYVAAVAGLVAIVTLALFFTAGQPFGTINDIALLVMTVALAPVMLAFYELGGVTPLLPARLSLGGAIAAIAVWSAVQAAMIVGLVSFDYDAPATGWFAVEAVMTIFIGAWLVGAPLLAGPWLPTGLRWLGAVDGLGWLVFGAGLLAGGAFHPLTYLGGVGYQVLFPIWMWLVGRHLQRIAASA